VRVKLAVQIACLALAVPLAACSSNGSSNAGSGAAATATALKIGPGGTPDLHGVSIGMGIAAGNPVPGDSTNYLLAQTLKSWGATIHYTIGATNSTELAVLAGQLQVTDGPLPILDDAGLTIIAPALTHVDDLLVSPTDTSVDQLKGQTVGVIASTDPSTYLLQQLAKSHGWSSSDLHEVDLQTDANAVNQLLAHKITAAFVASEDMTTLDSHGKYSVLASAAQLAPTYADSFNGTTTSWAKANPGLVEAVDLAWWHAAKVFNSDSNAWVQNAVAYIKNASTPTQVAQERTALMTFQPWPSAPSQASQILSLQTIQANYDAANSAGFIKGQGVRAASSMVDLGPWQAAAAIAAKYPNEY
jgi:ABC-type nitrate/sulfonate/bicarbonate transport system substrate-binding protein